MSSVDGRRVDARSAALPVVREIASDEIDRASEVVVSAYQHLLGDHLGEAYGRHLADVASRVAHATVLVAVDGDRVVGCVTAVDGQGPYAEFPDADAAGIRMLAVAPEAQGRGIGAALVRACLDRARAAGRARVVLHSEELMAAAQRLYEREGFARAPERDWEPDPGVHLLGYELVL